MKTAKAMGLAICSALLLTAVVGASVASAAQFRAEEYPTTVTGQTTTHKFTTWEKGPTWSCTNATSIGGTIAAASTTLSLTPPTSGCSFAGQAATVKVNTCKFVFNNSSEQLVNTGTVDVACSKEGDQIEITAAICVMKIPAQTARGPVQYSNAAGLQGYQRKINITPNATSFKYSLSGVGCGKAGSFEDGALSGNTLVKGTSAQHEVGIYLSNEQSANFPMFAAEKYPEVVEAQLVEASSVFKFPAAEAFSCSTIRGNGLISGVPKGQLTLGLRSWSGCSVITGGTVKRNGCSLTLAGPISGSGSLAIECPSGKELTFSLNLGFCTVTIPSQGALSSVTYKNTGSGATRAITATVNVTGVKYTTNSGSFCKKAGPQTDGSMTFTWELKGYQFLGSEQHEEEGVQFTEYIGGAQQGVWTE